MSRIRPRIPVGTLSLDYTQGGGVGSVTPVQLSASLGQDVNMMNIFDDSGQPVKVMFGPVGSEQALLTTSPGSDKDYPTLLNKGMRISILAVSGTISAGKIFINLYQ